MSIRSLTGLAMLCLGITGLGFSNPAEPEFESPALPLFESDELSDTLLAPTPISRRVDLSGGEITEIRVRVFPHRDALVTPHGRDTVVDQVRVRPATRGAQCRSYSSAATLPTEVVTSGAELLFTVAALDKPLWVRCDGAATVVRAAGVPSHSYSGLLAVHRASGRVPAVEVVESLLFEEYVRGVVPAEVPHTWRPAALAAQAVAARSYAYYRIILARRAQAQLSYDVDDTIAHQAYLGQSGWKKTTDLAVASTRSEVMTHSGDVVISYFHADSGGHTENAADIFGAQLPYCLGKPEAYEPAMHDSSWTETLKLADATTKLRAASLLAAGEALQGITIDPQTLPSGRAKTVWLELAGGARKQVRADRFRLTVGLKSTWFSVVRRDATVLQLAGRGFGHGVGMSQWGAQVMADKMGRDYKQILEFYYSGVRIEKP